MAFIVEKTASYGVRSFVFCEVVAPRARGLASLASSKIYREASGL